MRKRIELACSRAALMGAGRLVQFLPRATVIAFGSRVGDLAWLLTPARRRLAETNMARVFPDWEPKRVQEKVREVYRRQGMYLSEFLHMPCLKRESLRKIVEFRGVEHVLPAFRARRGIIGVSAHFGNFEILAAAAAQRGVRLTVIARDADDEATTSYVNGLRESMGYRVIPRHRAARESFAVLKRGEVLGVLCDQNDPTGVFVPFLDRLAGTTVGPASLALRTGAALFPCFVHREGLRHVVDVLPEIVYEPTGDLKRDIAALTSMINDAISKAIRERPEEWLWLHDRWRSAPPEDAGSEAGQK